MGQVLSEPGAGTSVAIDLSGPTDCLWFTSYVLSFFCLRISSSEFCFFPPFPLTIIFTAHQFLSGFTNNSVFHHRCTICLHHPFFHLSCPL